MKVRAWLVVLAAVAGLTACAPEGSGEDPPATPATTAADATPPATPGGTPAQGLDDY